ADRRLRAVALHERPRRRLVGEVPRPARPPGELGAGAELDPAPPSAERQPGADADLRAGPAAVGERDRHAAVGVADGRERAGRAERDDADRLAQLLLRDAPLRSEEHTSELQSRENLVCRLLLEKK